MSELTPALDGANMMTREDGGCYDGQTHNVNPELHTCMRCGAELPPVGATINGITYSIHGDVDGFMHLAGLMLYRDSMTKEREYGTTRFAFVKTSSGNPHIMPYMDVVDTDDVLAIADIKG